MYKPRVDGVKKFGEPRRKWLDETKNIFLERGQCSEGSTFGA